MAYYLYSEYDLTFTRSPGRRRKCSHIAGIAGNEGGFRI
jgi:hypothetical protein